jgi:nitrite reductase/ring-hydroxylating ferredoxin subunit
MAEGGQVKGEDLECPFHSWRFCGETGKCTGIPYSKSGKFLVLNTTHFFQIVQCYEQIINYRRSY